MKGCQLATMCDQWPKANPIAKPTKINTTETLIMTAVLLKLADSRTPTTRMTVITTMASKAKISIWAVIVCPKSESETAGVGLKGSFAPKNPTRLLR